jgi:hypothetical protein
MTIKKTDDSLADDTTKIFQQIKETHETPLDGTTVFTIPRTVTKDLV